MRHSIKWPANPVSSWMSWLVRTAVVRFQNRGKNLRIGYMASAKQCEFGRYNTLYDHVWLDRVKLGDMSYVARGSRAINASIGKFCCIGPETLIGLGRHPTREFISSHPAFYSTLKQSQLSFVNEDRFDEFRQITIGNDVWIGARAVILDGAIVGDGAIIAAGAVVSGVIPPYAIVRGVPAAVARFRFDEKTIEALLHSKWWDRDLAWLRENAYAFRDIEVFLRLTPGCDDRKCASAATVSQSGNNEKS